jgi:hypothetical protein
MKTKSKNQKMNVSGLFFALAATLMFAYAGATAQQQDSTKTLFKSDVKVSELWVPEVKLNSIQGDIGTLIGFYGGTVINKSYLLGIAGTAGAWGTASQGGVGGTWKITGSKTSGTIAMISASGKTTSYKFEVCGDGCIYFGNSKFAYTGNPECK